jgi:serine/threonine protein kinase
VQEKSYTVVDGLGIGGFATVVKVQEAHSKEYYAMKVISKRPPSHSTFSVVRDQILLEAEILSKLNHPFIQKCHDMFETEDNVFIVVDYISGGDLFFQLTQLNKSNSGGGSNGTRSSPKGFPQRIARTMLAEMYLGVAYIHSHNLIQRDLKIENVMVDANGHIKLIDFGLATQITSLVQPLNGCGTFAYASPEMFTERTGGRHTDWWAYGVVAYEMMTGSTPWSFCSDNKNSSALQSEILRHTAIKQPSKPISRVATHFINALLTHNYENRLGTSNDEEVKQHDFFRGIEWDDLAQLKCAPGFIPVSGINVDNHDRTRSIQAYSKMCF